MTYTVFPKNEQGAYSFQTYAEAEEYAMDHFAPDEYVIEDKDEEWI